MLNVSKVLLAIVVCMLFSASCREPNCDDGSLDPEERAWIPYNENERVVFYAANTQQHDTAFASAVTTYWSTGHSYDPDCAPHGTEGASQNLVFSSRSIPFSVSHDYNGTPTSASIAGLQIPVTSSGTMTINGHTYSDVRVAQYDSVVCVDMYVWRYYVNSEFGLLRFDQKNGPTWELER
jgi:hypothetical protein